MEKRACKIVVFCFEASAQIGMGHAMRSTVLAEVFKERGWKILLLTSQKSYDYAPFLHPFERMDANRLSSSFKYDLLVLDDYTITQKQEHQYRAYFDKILTIDDLADRPHDCDFLLDQTCGRQPIEYASKVPSHCKIFAGSQYALLRPEFSLLRPQALAKRRVTSEIKRILISFGGGESHSYITSALNILKKYKFAGDIDVVQGFNSASDGIYHNLSDKIHGHQNPNIAQLTYNADIGIGAAGSSVWERCCLALPSFLIKVAANQETIFNSLINQKIAFDLNNFENFSLNNVDYDAISKVVDGFGRNRVYLGITQESVLTFREITTQDKDLIYQWQHEKDLRRYFINTSLPSWSEHCEWFERRLKMVQNPFWIIEFGNSPCGVMSLSYDVTQSYFELGWYIIPAYQGKYLGMEAVKQVMQIVWPIPIKAYVKADNIASHRSLQKAGMRQIDANNYCSTELTK